MSKFTILAILGISLNIYATVINVPTDSLTIQAGLNGANEGDTVLVQAGTYFENIIWPDINGIQMLGSGEEDCIIDGNSSGSVIRFGVGFSGVIDSATIVYGFTLQGGYVSADSGGGIYCKNSAPKLVNVSIAGNIAHTGMGGGISCIDSSPVLKNVTISENAATFDYINGGGGYGGGVYCINSSPLLTNVTISNNTARRGGGIYCDNSNPVLTNSIIIENRAEVSCFPCAGHGGGIHLLDSNPTLISVVISGNVAVGEESNSYGGGIQCVNSNPLLTNVTITDNVASIGGGINCSNSDPIITDAMLMNNISGAGGGISIINSSPSLTGVSIINNTANGRGHYNPGTGGGIYCVENSHPIITNVTISANSSWGCSGVYISRSSPIITNSIIWNNLPREIALAPSSDTCSIFISYCDIKGGIDSIYTNEDDTVHWGEGNINSDPLFCNPDSSDYALSQDSPCLGAGINRSDMGAQGIGCDVLDTKNDSNIPTMFLLNQNYPNPFNPSTNITFEIPEATDVTLTIYDIRGRQIRTLINGLKPAGVHAIEWNGVNNTGKHVHSGVYFCRLQVLDPATDGPGIFNRTIKMIYLR